MPGELIFGGERFALTKTELYLPAVEEGEWRYLYIGVSGPQAGFGIWGAVLQAVERVEDLDGRRLHVHFGCYETYPDDTLGSDIVSIDDTTDLNYLTIEEHNYGFGEVQVDFERVDGHEFRCRFCLRVVREGGDSLITQPESLETEYPLEVRGEFTAIIQEQQP